MAISDNIRCLYSIINECHKMSDDVSLISNVLLT